MTIKSKPATDKYLGNWKRIFVVRTLGFSWIEGVIVVAIVLILAAFVWGAYSDSKRAVIELKMDEWECVASEERRSLRPMPVGKVMILQRRATTVCTEYRRRAT